MRKISALLSYLLALLLMPMLPHLGAMPMNLQTQLVRKYPSTFKWMHTNSYLIAGTTRRKVTKTSY